jgi:hypothetical protein
LGTGTGTGVKVGTGALGSFTMEETRGLRLLNSESDEVEEDDDCDLDRDLERDSSDDSADELPVKERRERRERRECASSFLLRPLRLRFGDAAAACVVPLGLVGCVAVALLPEPVLPPDSR